MKNENHTDIQLKQIKTMCRIISFDMDNEQEVLSNIENKPSPKIFPEYIQDTIATLYSIMKVTRQGV